VLRGLEKDRERRWPDALSFLQGLVKVADQLRQVSTQEVPVVRASAAAPSPVTALPATSSPRAGSRSGASELSREERVELLAQIEAAAKRVNEASRLAELSLQALAAGRVDDAARHLAQLEAMSPRHASIPDLRARLTAAGGAPAAAPAPARSPATAPVAPAAPVAAPARPDVAPAPVRAAVAAPARPPAAAAAAPAPAPAAISSQDAQRARVAEAEKLLDKYLRDRKQSLARFALDTLLELMPNHPRRGDYETWVEMMGAEAEQLKRAQAALDEGRQALARGDLAAARAKIAAIEKVDPSNRLADTFRRELEESAERSRAVEEAGRRRELMENLLHDRRLAEAEKELERLTADGMARVSIENYRLRIADIAALADRESKAQDFERRYRERVQKRDWMGARDVVLEFEHALPDAQRPAQLYSEVARFEEVHRKQQGIDAGIRQLETFLDQRKAAEAEMALKIVLQMAPDHPQRHAFEQRVRALKLGGR
jgi:hypothetical protein